MRSRRFVGWGVLTLAIIVPNICSAREIPDGLYFGQYPPTLLPEVFAPGIISLDDRYEYMITFSPNRDECVFGITNQYWSYFTMMYTSMDQDSAWADPVDAPFQGSGDGLLPTYSQDGERIYFVSSREVYPPTNIWCAERNAGGWDPPYMLPEPIKSDSDEWGPSLTTDEVMYFVSMRSGGLGQGDIYSADLAGDTTVVNLGPPINSAHNEASPFIAPDGSYLIFESDRPGGYGQVDLYISFNEGGVWSEPRNAGPDINTDQIDDGGFISPDGEYFFFNRREAWITQVQTDIFWVDARAILEPDAADIQEPDGSSIQIELHGNQPNPFTRDTTISYALPHPGPVTLTVFDVSGREVERLVSTHQTAGLHAAAFSVAHHALLPSGACFYELRFGHDSSLRRKMLFVK